MKLGAWACARVLKGEVAVEGAKDQTVAALCRQVPPGEHDVLPFAFWKVREETSINNREGATTRPVGTVARTVGTATCPKCGQKWESEPYNACGLSHHWFSGPCPKCGHAVGGAGVYTSTDGPRIESRYRDVVLDEPKS